MRRSSGCSRSLVPWASVRAGEPCRTQSSVPLRREEGLRGRPRRRAPPEDAAGGAADRVAILGGEAADRGLAEGPVLGAQAPAAPGDGEAGVEVRLPRRDDREEGVEYPTSLGVVVEAQVNEGLEEVPRLRDAGAHRESDVRPERARAARRALGPVAEECDQIAHRREAQPHHLRVPGRVDQLVEELRREAAPERDPGGVGPPREGVVGEVTRGERPVVPGDEESGVALVAAPCQDRRRIVESSRGIGHLAAVVGVALQRDRGGPGAAAADELDADGAGDRRSVRVPHHRHIEGEPARPPGHVPLPGAPEEHLAPGEEVRVGGDVRPAAVRGDVAEDAAGPGHVHRLQEDEIGRVLDLAGGVARGQSQVGDEPVPRVARVDLPVDAALDLLITPHVPERPTAERRRLSAEDLDPPDLPDGRPSSPGGRPNRREECRQEVGPVRSSHAIVSRRWAYGAVSVRDITRR